ncbi:uncharacterized protein QC763_205610 [Podospora pseudopauciseta]|uniref:Uncharacterized protein n=2 Tax=Podospora TaxID=5144 RepID=A0A090CD56_PODAN|nr:hypothetical protein QC763_205610 [Podospora pseudopauciseta]CDP25550.1 Putative protein of unknown function [Podospora anserina S mat+]
MSNAAGGSSRKSSVVSGFHGERAGGASSDTVGSLLAAIGTCLTDALRLFMFADKRHWGPDEFEQTRALEDALDEAKKDFQEMGQLVRGQFYYENDRIPESLNELRLLLAQFQEHYENLKSWARQGGPINPIWARDTSSLRKDLHRAQCRAARRISLIAEQPTPRCLGATQVYRLQKRNEAERLRLQKQREALPPWQQQQQQSHHHQRPDHNIQSPTSPDSTMPQITTKHHPLRRPPSLESLVPKCNQIGRFQRLNSGNPSESPFNDAAFICDFCNGYLVWPDLRTMPSVRSTLPQQPPPDPLSPAYDSKTVNNGYPHWQASGLSCTANEPKTLVFAPLAIANHMPPEPGEWQAGIVCPYCEEDTYLDEGEDSGEMKYVMDDKGFGSVEEFREHLEWYHTAMAVPKLEDVVPEVVRGSCGVM